VASLPRGLVTELSSCICTPRRKIRRAKFPTVVATDAHDGLGESRRAQLIRDLALTPEGRVRESEETLRLTELRAPALAHSIRAFDRYDDFLDYQRRRDLPR